MSEHQNIEWKESWRDEYLKWICGFANADGGTLVIGKDDKGSVVGVTDTRRLLVDIPNKVRDILGIMVDVNLRKSAGKEMIEIVVEPYPYPVSYKGEYHYRSGSTKQELKGAALDRFLLKKQGKHWDGVPVPKVNVRELSKPTFDIFRKRTKQSRRLDTITLRESAKGLIEKLHLLDGSHLKRAALLLFHPEPERFVSGAYVKIGFFRTNTDLAYQDEIHGNLFVQVDTTMDLLMTKYLKAGISYQGVQRIETLPVPEAALREAVLNAIIHKDYASGTPLQLSVYPDKLLIWNPGKLPQDWTIAKLQKKHPSRPFNPDVANAFFRAGMIEAWGRGIEKMIEACRTAGVPKPLVRYESDGLWVEFAFSKAYMAGVTTPETTPMTTPKTTQEKITLVPGQPESRPESQPESRPESQPESLELRVLKMLRVRPQSKNEISTSLGHRKVSGQLNKVIRLLLLDQNIEYTIPNKPNSRLQRYRLTEKGTAFLRKWDHTP